MTTPDRPLHSVVVTGVAFRNGGEEVLVIQRMDDSTWVVPGGILELDESPEEGVARELLEETGLVVRAVSLAGVYKNMVKGIVTLSFGCIVLSDDDVSDFTGPETRQAAWITISETENRMNEVQWMRVIDALMYSRLPVRIHDGVHVWVPKEEHDDVS